jgi:hypothetical protein
MLNDKINDFYKTIKISDLLFNPSATPIVQTEPAENAQEIVQKRL